MIGDEEEAAFKRRAHRDLVDREKIDFTSHLHPRQQYAFAYLLTQAEELEDDFSLRVLKKWQEISPSVGPIPRNRSEQLVDILRTSESHYVERTTEPARRGGLFRRRRPRYEGDDYEGGGLHG